MKTTRRSVRMYSLQATISLLEGTTAFSFDKDLPGATPELEVGQAPEAVPQLDRSSSLVPRWLRPIQRQSLLGFHMAIHAKEFLALGRTIARPALLETVDDFSEFARPWAGWIEGEIEAEFDDEVHRSARQHFGERGWLVDTTRAKVGTLELLTDLLVSTELVNALAVYGGARLILADLSKIVRPLATKAWSKFFDLEPVKHIAQRDKPTLTREEQDRLLFDWLDQKTDEVLKRRMEGDGIHRGIPTRSGDAPRPVASPDDQPEH